jgi:flagellar biosynthesis/type III secretory pathway protein FliH
LRILGKGRVQQQAIRELAALPGESVLRTRAFDLLFSWSINIESRDDLDEEDRALIMQLSPLYTQRLAETLEQGRQAGMQAGMQAGIQTERRLTIETLLQSRFGTLDAQISATVDSILQQSAEEYTRLLLELPTLSREELLNRFTK